MGTIITAAQIRRAKRNAMPAPLGDLHFLLAQEVTWLHVKWDDFCQLFANSRDTFDILNAAAPTFFGDLQRTLWEDVLLHVCRLTDRPRINGHDTLTLKRLPPSIPHAPLQRRVQRLLLRLESKSRFARDRRDQRLAHIELPIPKPPRFRRAGVKHVDEVLKIMRDTLSCIERHYMKRADTAYEHTIEALGGVTALVHFLEKGVEREGPDAPRRMNL